MAVNVGDVSRPSRYYAIRGQVIGITAEGGAEHIGSAFPAITCLHQ